jgi:hypothetical protein
LPRKIFINGQDPLGKFYNKNGKKAGTYTWDGKTWRYEPRR